VIDLFRCLPNPVVWWPIEVSALVLMRIVGLVLLLGEEWLMGIESLNVQEPVILICILAACSGDSRNPVA